MSLSLNYWLVVALSSKSLGQVLACKARDTANSSTLQDIMSLMPDRTQQENQILYPILIKSSRLLLSRSPSVFGKRLVFDASLVTAVVDLTFTVTHRHTIRAAWILSASPALQGSSATA